jgi:hypothetical protein
VPIHARMRAALANLDQASSLKATSLIASGKPKAMIGWRLSQEEAKRLLAKFDH